MSEENHKLVLSSVLENVCLLDEFAQDIFETYSIDPIYHGRVETCLAEAVSNAIIFGNSSDPEKSVVIEFKNTDKYYEFTVSDEGEGFDYNDIPDPTLPENIEKETGRGLYMMKTLSDELKFERSGARVIIRFLNNSRRIG